jgi:type I restriction enzyme S subunit
MPENWVEITLGDICYLLDGEKKNGKFPNLDAKFLRGQREATILDNGRFVPKGSNIILVDGENSGEIFKTLVDGYLGSTFKELFITNSVYLDYILLFIEFHKDFLKNTKKGAAIPHLNRNLFLNLSFPLPPLHEQKRIVAKIEELLPICEKL